MEYRIVVLGDKQVGKTSLIKQFISNQFNEETEVTIEDQEYKKQVKIPGEESCGVKVIDTAFTGQSSNMVNLAQVYVIVYDITEKVTFGKLDLYIKRIKEINNINETHRIPVVLVGNKKDLVDLVSGRRQVTRSEGKKLLKKWGGDKNSFIEITARDNGQVNQVFEQALKQLWKKLQSSVEAGPEQKNDCTMQ